MNPEMKFADYRYLVLSDLYRITGNTYLSAFCRQFLIDEGYKYCFWMRTCRYVRDNRALRLWLFPLAWLMLRRYTHKYGISVPFQTEIGPGFYIGHFGGIVISAKSKIGKNCNVSQGVTLGRANRGRNKGYPTVGDNVYLGPGAKIVGAVKIGNNVAVGANCVVTKDIPDDAVVVGVPGEVISSRGSEDYVNRTDYEGRIG
jgi:serine O-acetyltransferase